MYLLTRLQAQSKICLNTLLRTGRQILAFVCMHLAEAEGNVVRDSCVLVKLVLPLSCSLGHVVCLSDGLGGLEASSQKAKTDE